MFLSFVISAFCMLYCLCVLAIRVNNDVVVKLSLLF